MVWFCNALQILAGVRLEPDARKIPFKNPDARISVLWRRRRRVRFPSHETIRQGHRAPTKETPMPDLLSELLKHDDRTMITRRTLLQALGVAAVAAPVSALAQGRCMLTYGTPACNTTPIPPLFEPTGWKTVALDHLTFRVAEYRKEAAFYIALMGWTLRNDDGTQAVLDVGDWGSVVFKQAAAASMDTAAGGGGRGGPVRAVVESFCFVIDPWNAARVEAALRARGLAPVAENDGKGFESFHVKDPDGFALQISNGNGLARDRRTPSNVTLAEPAPFAPTGWKTVWLDHLSFGVTNYKESVSFYSNLLGWKETYDEGSQNELMIGDVGDAILRGGNPLDPDFGKPNARGRRGGAGDDANAAAAAPRGTPARRASIDHISFGISPWDTDGVKSELEKRGLKAQIDTSSRHLGPDGTYVPDEIHTAAFKSYHTTTPNGYNLQISYVTRANRLALPNAVKPKSTGE
jgi:catechol 2,3-dioxygenase-like lactoylglutathione lyase family enzyme